MKQILEIYNDYNIIPGLQQHQLRVAAVAKQICESMRVTVDIENVVKTCLLHDMGNIIKSNLTIFPEFLGGKSIEYWQAIKDEYISKYGNDEHIATEEIAQELKVDQKIIEYLNYVGFSKAILNAKSGVLEGKICCYSDMRVGPYGVLSLKERLKDGEKRYKGTKKWIINKEIYGEIVQSLYSIEKQIVANSNFTPEKITDQSIKKNIEEVSSTLF